MSTGKRKDSRATPRDTRGRMIRPVRCHFCGRAMYYFGQPHHEPEVRVNVCATGALGDTHAEFYAHLSCWNKRMEHEDAEVRRG